MALTIDQIDFSKCGSPLQQAVALLAVIAYCQVNALPASTQRTNMLNQITALIQSLMVSS